MARLSTRIYYLLVLFSARSRTISFGKKVDQIPINCIVWNQQACGSLFCKRLIVHASELYQCLAVHSSNALMRSHAERCRSVYLSCVIHIQYSDANTLLVSVHNKDHSMIRYLPFMWVFCIETIS